MAGLNPCDLDPYAELSGLVRHDVAGESVRFTIDMTALVCRKDLIKVLHCRCQNTVFAADNGNGETGCFGSVSLTAARWSSGLMARFVKNRYRHFAPPFA